MTVIYDESLDGNLDIEEPKICVMKRSGERTSFDRMKIVEAIRGANEEEGIVSERLTEEQIKKLRNLDNKLNESEWDYDLLKFDIEDLDFSGFEVDWNLPINIDEDMLNDLFEDAEIKEKEPKKIQCPHCGEWFES